MKTKILKLSSLLLALISLFILSITNAYAASSTYEIATYFTFSSDMDIDEGFRLIKPFILYEDGQPCTANYTFNATSNGNNSYTYSGVYPDGSTYRITAYIRVMEDASGTYVEALLTEPYFRQSIYVKDLNQGKATNNCLEECWNSRFVCIKDPTYSVFDEPTQNIYPHMTSFENAAGTHNLLYYAVIENVNYTPDETPDDNNNTQLPDDNNTNDPSLDDPIIPDDGNNNETPPSTDDNNSNNDNTDKGDNNTNNGNNNENNNQQPNNPNDNQQPQNPTDNNDVKDDSSKIKTILIVTGSLVGIVLIYLLYLVFKAVIVWLRR